MTKANDCHWTPIVAVPAKNEAEYLPALLRALARQTWVDHSGRPLGVVLVLNNCNDASAAVVRDLAGESKSLDLTVFDVALRPPSAHVGTARRLAMDAALAKLAQRPSGAILTTDADAVPHPDWVDANLAALSAGADAVGGRIIGDRVEEALLGEGLLRRARLHMRYAALCDHLASQIDPLAHDPWPRHQDHTGASLAVTASAYRAVGGMPAVPFREDLAFVSRLRAADLKVVHPLSVQVGVSARLTGRAPGGMADCLKAWMAEEAAGQPLLVEDPDALLARLRLRRTLRSNRALGAGAAIERLAQDDPDAPKTSPIHKAIHVLEELIRQNEGALDAV